MPDTAPTGRSLEQRSADLETTTPNEDMSAVAAADTEVEKEKERGASVAEDLAALQELDVPGVDYEMTTVRASLHGGEDPRVWERARATGKSTLDREE